MPAMSNTIEYDEHLQVCESCPYSSARLAHSQGFANTTLIAEGLQYVDYAYLHLLVL